MKRLLLAMLMCACSDGSTAMDATPPDADVDAGREDASAEDGAIEDAGVDDASAGRFEPIADLALGARQETAVVTLGGEVFVIGGYDDTPAFGGLVEAYDPGSNTWRRAADVPVPVHHSNAAAAAGKIYVLGFLADGFAESERCFEYDPIADQWTEIDPLPMQRRRGASVTIGLDDKIYLIGGLRGLASVADVDEFDPATGTFNILPLLPRAMDHGVGGGFAGKLYVAGGRAGGITSHTDQLDIYDVATGVWSTGASMPTGRGGAAAAMLNGRLYVFGGEGKREVPGERVFEEVEAYDVALDGWFSLTPMDPPRHGMGAAALTNRIIVPGGATIEGFGATASSEAFFP